MSNLLGTQIRLRYKQIIDQVSSVNKNPMGSDIKIVVVSKAQPIEVINEAITCGITYFGENYVEEASSKINHLQNKSIKWHMIGHVQSRKATLVARYFDLVHSVDSIKLATRIDKACAEIGRALPVFIEINTSGESSKYGFSAWSEQCWPALLMELDKILKLRNLAVQGLMTMPPYTSDAEMSRPYFKKLRHFQDFLKCNLPHGNWSELSMGSSQDFLVAVEEGATYLRIGEAILGRRVEKGIHE